MSATTPAPTVSPHPGQVPGPVLVAEHVSKTFPPARRGAPATRVLEDVSLTATRGEFLAIVGPSGSGKSTLLYCLSGLEPLTGGTVRILGRDLDRLTRNARAVLRRDHVGFVFQHLNLIDSLTAAQNVELPTRLSRRSVSEEDVAAILDHVGLHERGDFRPGRLSGGEQQRVAIARVLAAGPDLVFADEPTGALDSVTGRTLIDMLRGAATAGSTVVMVTHDLGLAALADRVIVLHDGRIRHELHRPTPAQLLEALASHAPRDAGGA